LILKIDYRLQKINFFSIIVIAPYRWQIVERTVVNVWREAKPTFFHDFPVKVWGAYHTSVHIIFKFLQYYTAANMPRGVDTFHAGYWTYPGYTLTWKVVESRK